MDNKLDQFIEEIQKEEARLGLNGDNRASFWFGANFVLQSLRDAMLADVQSLRDAPPPYPADKDNPLKHIYQNEGYAKALDAIIEKWGK